MEDLNAWGRPVNGARRDKAVYVVTAALGAGSVVHSYLAMSVFYWDSWPEGWDGALPGLILLAAGVAYALSLHGRLRAARGISLHGALAGLVVPPIAGVTDEWELVRLSAFLPEMHWVGAAICSALLAFFLFLGHFAAGRLCSGVHRGRAMDRRELWALGAGALALCFAGLMATFRVLGGPGAEDNYPLRMAEIGWGVLGALVFLAGSLAATIRRVWAFFVASRSAQFELRKQSGPELESARIFASCLDGTYRYVLHRRAAGWSEPIGRL